MLGGRDTIESPHHDHPEHERLGGRIHRIGSGGQDAISIEDASADPDRPSHGCKLQRWGLRWRGGDGAHRRRRSNLIRTAAVRHDERRAAALARHQCSRLRPLPARRAAKLDAIYSHRSFLTAEAGGRTGVRGRCHDRDPFSAIQVAALQALRRFPSWVSRLNAAISKGWRNPVAHQAVSRGNDTNPTVDTSMRGIRRDNLPTPCGVLANARFALASPELLAVCDADPADGDTAALPGADTITAPGAARECSGRIHSELGHLRLPPDGVGARWRSLQRRYLSCVAAHVGLRPSLVGRGGAADVILSVVRRRRSKPSALRGPERWVGVWSPTLVDA